MRNRLTRYSRREFAALMSRASQPWTELDTAIARVKAQREQREADAVRQAELKAKARICRCPIWRMM